MKKIFPLDDSGFEPTGGIKPPNKLERKYLKHNLGAIIACIESNTKFLLNPGSAREVVELNEEIAEAMKETREQLALLHRFLRHIYLRYLSQNKVHHVTIAERMDEVNKFARLMGVDGTQKKYSPPDAMNDTVLLLTLHDTCVSLRSWYIGNIDTLPPDIAERK